MEFWKGSDSKYDKRVLIIPNYTYFGKNKDINSDSFVLVMKSFLNNTENEHYHFTIPYPDGYIPADFIKYPNVTLVNMGKISTFPPVMRTQFPSNFFKSKVDWDSTDIVWSHLPEWTNQALILRRYSKMGQRIIGYCHWWEIPENGGYQYNSFTANVTGMLQMEECGVNSDWVKRMVIKRAGDYFNQNVLDKLDKIIQPWYLGTESFTTGTVEPKTILFNHRANPYTGAEWFFKEIDKLWKIRQDFKVLTSISDVDRSYVQSIRAIDRNQYLKNVASADIGVGCFRTYSAWSMSATDGLSVGVPYILPRGLCYEEMVGDDYPLFYDTKKEFVKILVDYLDGKIERPNTKKITERLYWKNSLKDWKVL